MKRAMAIGKNESIMKFLKHVWLCVGLFTGLYIGIFALGCAEQSSPQINATPKIKSAEQAGTNEGKGFVGQQLETPSNPMLVNGMATTPGSCPDFPLIVSPVNSGGGDCGDACVRKLGLAYDYLVSIGVSVARTKNSVLSSNSTLAKEFYRTLKDAGRNIGCNPLHNVAYQ